MKNTTTKKAPSNNHDWQVGDKFIPFNWDNNVYEVIEVGGNYVGTRIPGNKMIMRFAKNSIMLHNQ